MPIDPWSCVSLSSPLWADTKNGSLLWQAIDPDEILFSPASPTLVRDPTSRKFAAAATLFRDATGALIGGSVSFSAYTSAIGATQNLQALLAGTSSSRQ